MKNGRIGRGVVVKTILSCIAVAGLVTVALLIPNAVQALTIFGLGKKKYKVRNYLNLTINKLHKRGLIVFRQDGENRFVELTEKGRGVLDRNYTSSLGFTTKKPRWDGKWRMVIFDIKEYDRQLRDLLRDGLINIGFVKVQNSVWIFPYDCEELVFLLKTNFELGKNVLFVVVEKMENDSWLRKEFNLKSQA